MERGNPDNEFRKQATAFALAIRCKEPIWEKSRRTLHHTECFGFEHQERSCRAP
ncbi:MAG: hypothetical protein KatS3mg019_1395 [Fimbriimonadales bacterium]|nr:MAG: hypothetical protein KatS3mg019_1395 [Fimbriimonadales bacterium]